MFNQLLTKFLPMFLLITWAQCHQPVDNPATAPNRTGIEHVEIFRKQLQNKELIKFHLPERWFCCKFLPRCSPQRNHLEGKPRWCSSLVTRVVLPSSSASTPSSRLRIFTTQNRCMEILRQSELARRQSFVDTDGAAKEVTLHWISFCRLLFFCLV